MHRIKAVTALLPTLFALATAAGEPAAKETPRLEALIGRIVDEKLAERGLDDPELNRRIEEGVRRYLEEERRRRIEEDRHTGGQR